jgi:RNA polymerase sigma-70 factor (ECF subfamily)
MADPNSSAALEDLFERYRRDGELDALGRVYDLASPQLHAFARRLAPSRADAEDLVQATFLTAIERAEAYDASRKLLPWLLGIFAHHALSARRARDRKPDPERIAARGVEDPADSTESREIDAAARAALAELPPRYRGVLEPVLLGDERAIDVALRRGASAGVVRMQLHRGLALLRKALPAGAALSALVFTGRSRALEAQRETVLEAARRRAIETGLASAREPALAPAARAPTSHAPAPRGSPPAWRWSLVASTLLVITALWWGVDAWSRARPSQEPGVAGPLAAAPAHEGPPSEFTSTRAELAAALDAQVEGEVDGSADAATAARLRPSAPTLTVELRWADGEPAEFVEVVVQRLDSPDVQRYAMRGVTNARGRIVFRECGGRLSVRPDRGPPITVEVAADEQRVLPIELPIGVDVAVRVVDIHGAPVADALIGFSVLHHFLFGAPIAITDAHGRAAVRHVPRGRVSSRGSAGSSARPPPWSAAAARPPRTPNPARRSSSCSSRRLPVCAASCAIRPAGRSRAPTCASDPIRCRRSATSPTPSRGARVPIGRASTSSPRCRSVRSSCACARARMRRGSKRSSCRWASCACTTCNWRAAPRFAARCARATRPPSPPPPKRIRSARG